MHASTTVRRLLRLGVFAASVVLVVWQIALFCHQSDVAAHETDDTCAFCIAGMHAAGVPSAPLFVAMPSPVVPAFTFKFAIQSTDASVYQGRAPPWSLPV